ncbi:hypothetical protein EW026_g505 [Hermanssonia centrifuga]|uniref:Het-C-domain-containing protein n=1 Tax=Hermanssonia centrifuga TaxID=98765 RepID=A0A4S4KUK5_9APHY|nr:hypothetical protein EW026_g505 [Hermanssonia centrifuga]
MNNLTILFLVLTVLVVLPTETYAFGAGEIPDFAYLNDKAFRHGDIENILAELAKTAGHAAASGGLLSLAQSVFSAASGGSKFSHEDVKRVYFGNWLRDYSQAMDIAGLSKLTSDTLVLIVSVLGFLTFGFATEEYQVTPERLGVYLPVEHIDNPKGYAEKEGDARQFHPKLRPPVNPEELEIDPKTGMKKYMASDHRGWDTSTAHIRRTFRACIEHGRHAHGREGADLWEAYRLLGTGLHTMEDLLAHSNWCELALLLINTPNGEAPPLVTGTFGGADFLHSLMGEATDHLSQASVVDLSKNLADAQQNGVDPSLIRSILKKLPIGGGADDADTKMSEADAMQEKSKAYQFNPDDVAPPEVQQQLWELLKWRDGIFREVIGMIQMVPGLSDLIDSLTNALNAYVYTILAPYLSPILQQVTSVLGEGSKAVIDSDDQYEDHFGLILNEPAGKTALVVVRYSVKLIVDAWFDEHSDSDQVIDQILEAFHHPYFNTGRSRIQQEMFEEMEKWIGGLGPDVAENIIEALTKQSVREGKNKRQGSDDDMAESNRVYGQVNTPANQPSFGGGHTSAQGNYGPQAASYGSGGRQQDYGVPERGYEGREYGSSQPNYGTPGTQNYGQSEERYRPSEGQYDDASANRRNQQASTYDRNDPSYGTSRRPDYSAESQDVPYESSTEGYGRTYGDNTYASETTERSYERTDYDQENSRAQPRVSSYVTQEAGYNPSYTPAYIAPEASREEYGGSRRTEYGGEPRDDYREGFEPETQERRGGDEYGIRLGGESIGNRRRGYGDDVNYGSERRGNGEGEYTRESDYGRPAEAPYDGDSSYGRRREGYAEDGARYGRRAEDDSDNYASRDVDEQRGYSTRRDEGEGYARTQAESYPSRDSGRNYRGDEYGGRGGDEYGGRGSYGDDTFGAERLRISENDDEERPHRHHRKRDEDEY